MNDLSLITIITISSEVLEYFTITAKWHAASFNHLSLLTFRQGLEDTSKEALKARRCCVVSMVRGRFDRLCSLPSSPPFPAKELLPPSSSSLFTVNYISQKNYIFLQKLRGLMTTALSTNVLQWLQEVFSFFFCSFLFTVFQQKKGQGEEMFHHFF